MLNNKSILLPKDRNDGLRICVMRSIHDEYEFDMWWPILAPSRRLVEDYAIDKLINWEEFTEKYSREQDNHKCRMMLDTLVELIKSFEQTDLPVTLLCGEDDYLRCHRKIIADECLKRYPALVIENSK